MPRGLFRLSLKLPFIRFSWKALRSYKSFSLQKCKSACLKCHPLLLLIGNLFLNKLETVENSVSLLTSACSDKISFNLILRKVLWQLFLSIPQCNTCCFLFPPLRKFGSLLWLTLRSSDFFWKKIIWYLHSYMYKSFGKTNIGLLNWVSAEVLLKPT